MATLTLEIPDELLAKIECQGRSAEEVIVEVLAHYIDVESNLVEYDITCTRTWQLVGTLRVAESDAETTHYSETVDNVLYRGV